MMPGDIDHPGSVTGDRPRLPFPKPPAGDTGAETDRKPVGAPAPFSIRLTAGEREALEAAAGRQPLGAYIRGRLFNDSATPRRTHRKPVQDDEAAARVLARLGQSRLSSNLNQLAKAAHIGALPVTPEIAEELRAACDDVRAMRLDLMRALGLRDMAP